MPVITIDEGLVRVVIDGECAFEGSKEELIAVLRTHRQLMDYIDAHDGDGVLHEQVR